MRIRIMVLCALSVTACSIPVPPPEPVLGAVVRTARAVAAPAPVQPWTARVVIVLSPVERTSAGRSRSGARALLGIGR